MRSTFNRLLAAAALAVVVAGAAPASAQPFGYGYDDGPPPFRRGPGWDGPPRGGQWDRWHHRRHWRDEGFDRRGGWRDGEGRRGPGGPGGRERFGDDSRRGFNGNDDGPRGGGRPGFRPFGNDNN